MSAATEPRTYRFTWDAFDDALVEAVAAVYGHRGPGARAFLAEHLPRPRPKHMRDLKPVLEAHWLPGYAGTGQIVEHLLEHRIGPMGRSSSQREQVDYIRKCRNSKTIRRLLAQAMQHYGDLDRDGDDDRPLPELLPRFAWFDPAEQPEDARSPYPFQGDAMAALGRHLAEAEQSEVFQGLLVMPTGAGKTFTAVRWLYDHAIQRGLRVLWVAHRYELLYQAAQEFYRQGGRAAGRRRPDLPDAPEDRFRVRIVSGRDCSMTQVDPADDVVIASIYSLARRSDLRDALLADPNLIVVIDEAHHAPAKSYRSLIGQLRGQKPYRLLGLTATPTRMVEMERGLLHELFGGRILYDVPIADLIDQAFLARPVPVEVRTEAEVERNLSDEDLEHLLRFHDLSEAWLDRIAHYEERNRVVVDHYLENRDRYGKTLIFAINVDHAALLAAQLQAEGVAADYVAYRSPDGRVAEVGDALARLKDPDGGLEVLVNVAMLTEGVDVPAVQTVFLVRPTRSEILMRQMVGRALRGVKAGGTELAYLVAFADQWERFTEWQQPFSLLPDLVIEPVDEDGKAIGTGGSGDEPLFEALPWAVVQLLRERMRVSPLDGKADVFEAIPQGWYLFPIGDEEDSGVQRVFVYEHQLPCWEAMIAQLRRQLAGQGEALGLAEVYEAFFHDCDRPQPSRMDVTALAAYVLSSGGGEELEHVSSSERSACDPYAVARQIVDDDLRMGAASALIEQRFALPLAKAVYGDLRQYRAAVEDAIFEAQHPEQSTRIPMAVPVFEPLPDLGMKRDAPYDLRELFEEMLAIAGAILETDDLRSRVRLDWTRRYVKGWFARAYWERSSLPGDGEIRVNVLLNSSDVARATLRFLLWHEYLHLYLQQGHTPEFRRLERLWPDHAEADRDMDSLEERFEIQYW